MADTEHDGQMREIISQVMREHFLSDDPDVVRRELDAFQDAHDMMHGEMSAIMEIMAGESDVRLEPWDVIALAMKFSKLSTLHIAVEHFELTIKDHLTRLEEGRVTVERASAEALLDRVQQAIALAFEGEGEAWSDKLSGDRLAAVARRAVEPIIAEAVS